MVYIFSRAMPSSVTFATRNNFSDSKKSAILQSPIIFELEPKLPRFLGPNDPMYPRNDPQTSADIDKYLSDHYTSTRRISPYLFSMFFSKPLGIEMPFSLDHYKKMVVQGIEELNARIGDKKKYIVGNEITLADLAALMEVLQ
jgi:hypothetical protein